MLEEAEQLGSEGRLGERRGAAPLDPRGHLDHVVGRQTFQRVVVADVDDLHVPVSRRERSDQLGRRIAVVRAAPLLEQGRLRRESRVPVELEQLPLDLRHFGGPRSADALLGEHVVVEVEVVEVVGGDRAEPLQELPRELDVLG